MCGWTTRVVQSLPVAGSLNERKSAVLQASLFNFIINNHLKQASGCAIALRRLLPPSGSAILNRLPERGGSHARASCAETSSGPGGGDAAAGDKHHDRGRAFRPRIDFCYVTEVALNPGGKSARVYVAVDSSVKDIAQAEVKHNCRPRSC